MPLGLFENSLLPLKPGKLHLPLLFQRSSNAANPLYKFGLFLIFNPVNLSYHK